MTTASVKDEIRKLAERLPDDATWEDLQYQIYVRQAVEAGLKDSKEGRVVTLEEARRSIHHRNVMGGNHAFSRQVP
jgi:predicted transcriptional regulator